MDKVQAQSGRSTHLGGGERMGLPNESMAASRQQEPAETCALPPCSGLRVRAEHEKAEAASRAGDAVRTMEILEAEESGTSVHSNESKRCSRGHLVNRHSTTGPASASGVERLPRRVVLVSEESQRRCGGASYSGVAGLLGRAFSLPLGGYLGLRCSYL